MGLRVNCCLADLGWGPLLELVQAKLPALVWIQFYSTCSIPGFRGERATLGTFFWQSLKILGGQVKWHNHLYHPPWYAVCISSLIPHLQRQAKYLDQMLLGWGHMYHVKGRYHKIKCQRVWMWLCWRAVMKNWEQRPNIPHYTIKAMLTQPHNESNKLYVILF